MNLIFRKLNSAYYRYRKLRIRVGVKLLNSPKDIKINKPIFLLGTQSGGLTLLSRILHHHPKVVYTTGNCKYWAGSDELFFILDGILPEPLSWRRVKETKFKLLSNHSWLYATDKLLPFYRSTENDATEKLEKAYKDIIKKIIYLNRTKNRNEDFRFIDKGQINTVKVALIQKLLENNNPRFVLLTRNPFAVCWRAVKNTELKLLDISDKEKMLLAAQHWANSFEAALQDSVRVNLNTWRFEDLLVNPREIISEICKFVGLEYSESLLPHPKQNIPFGSAYDAFTNKWYPFRQDVNKKHLNEIPPWAVEIIKDRCGNLIQKFDYSEFGP